MINFLVYTYTNTFLTMVIIILLYGFIYQSSFTCITSQKTTSDYISTTMHQNKKKRGHGKHKKQLYMKRTQ